MYDIDYKESIWYYPYIKNDIGNKQHLSILNWLRENFSDKLWILDWKTPENSPPQYKYNRKNLYLSFKSSDMAMAFKLRWTE